MKKETQDDDDGVAISYVSVYTRACNGRGGTTKSSGWIYITNFAAISPQFARVGPFDGRFPGAAISKSFPRFHAALRRFKREIIS